MTSSYKFHEGVGEIVPFYARYQYPTQANKAWKTNVKIPPRNGFEFRSGQMGASLSIDLPAQGYLHTANSCLSFDLELISPGAKEKVNDTLRIQNNVQSIFERMRISYGSLVIEDLRKSNVLVRMITEGTNGNTNHTIDQNAILEGIGGTTLTSGPNLEKFKVGTADAELTPINRLVNARVATVQTMNTIIDGSAVTNKGDTRCIRRYTVQLPFGLMQQNKLLPLKWMASQLSIQLDLASSVECLFSDAATDGIAHQFIVTNMFYNAELLEYDSSYDAAFLEGLRGSGVPLKFASWNTYVNAPSNGNTQTLLIPERNRSLKALFTVQLPPPHMNIDSHAMVQSSNGLTAKPAVGTFVSPATTKGYVQEFQYRIGGKYYPAQPVQCGSHPTISNGCAEAYVEYAKALNILGDYRLHSAINPNRWAPQNGADGAISVVTDWLGAESHEQLSRNLGGWGPSAFVIAANLESSTGGEISGLNGEEQNDISLVIKYSNAQDPTFVYYTFVYYDALLVLRENNLVELIK